MNKKNKKQLDVLVGIKKNASDIIPTCSIDFCVGEKILTKNEIFSGVVKEIHSLAIDKTITIKYKEEYNMVFSDFKKKITNIVFSHASKFVEKKFTTNKIDSETIIVTRHKDKTF